MWFNAALGCLIYHPMRLLDQPEIPKAQPPIILGLTDDYTPEALAASWEKALHLIAAHPANEAILLNHGQEPYIFPISHKATINPDAIYIWTQHYFKWLQHPEFQPGVIKQLEEWASSHPEKPSPQRLEHICNLYLRFIKKTHPADLTMAKNFALMLPSTVAYQPGYRNFKILQDFDPALTVENIKAFQELAAAQQDHDCKSYHTLAPQSADPAEYPGHVLSSALFIRQKTHLIANFNTEKQKNGIKIAHPLCNASTLLIASILGTQHTSQTNLMWADLRGYTKSPPGNAFLRDLGRLFDLNPHLSRPIDVPERVKGPCENPYAIDAQIWRELELACRNSAETYKELSKIQNLYEVPELPMFTYRPKTWLGKYAYYLYTSNKVLAALCHKGGVITEGLKSVMEVWAEIGRQMPAFIRLEAIMIATQNVRIKVGRRAQIAYKFWREFFATNPNGNNLEQLIPYYLGNESTARYFQAYLKSDKKSIHIIGGLAISQDAPRLEAFSLKVLADYCENDPQKATDIALKLLNSGSTHAKHLIFAFVAYFENPQPIIEAITAATGDISANPTTEESKAGQKTPERQSGYLSDLFEGEMPPRDLAAMRDNIMHNRTSHISHDGNIIKAHLLTSPLSVYTEEIRISKNKDTKKHPDGLACNASINPNSRLGGARLYIRLTADGNLVMRVLDKANTELDRAGYISRLADGMPASQLAKEIAVFDELNYMVLEALAVVCVRKQSRTITPVPDHPPSSETIEGPEVTPPSSSQPDVIPGAPETTAREEGEMTLDLTDEEKTLRRAQQREDKIKIQSNLGKVRALFAPLSRGQELPEISAAEIQNLLLHEAVELDIREADGKINKTTIYEASNNPLAIYNGIRTGTIDPAKIYIRVSRAFSQPLPYIKSSRKVTFLEDENDADSQLKTVRYFSVRKKKIRAASAELKQETFIDSEKGETIKIGTMSKFLNFDVTDTAQNRRLFEKMRSGETIPGILSTIEREICQTLDEQRRVVRAKYLENLTTTPNLEKYSRVMNKLEALAKGKYAQAEKIANEIAAKTLEIIEPVETAEGIQHRTKLRLPHPGFHFDQTFNQGRFKTLAEILGLAPRP